VIGLESSAFYAISSSHIYKQMSGVGAAIAG